MVAFLYFIVGWYSGLVSGGVTNIQIQPGGGDARRLPSRVSRVPRVRTDASRPCRRAFRAGPHWHTSDGRWQHAQPGSRPQGYYHIAQGYIRVGPALMKVPERAWKQSPHTWL